jgi:hypothetical protein
MMPRASDAVIINNKRCLIIGSLFSLEAQSYNIFWNAPNVQKNQFSKNQKPAKNSFQAPKSKTKDGQIR